MTAKGQALIDATLGEAVQITISALRNGIGQMYGYDLWVDSMVRQLCYSQDPQVQEQVLLYSSAKFYEAAWLLAERGVLRPGVRSKGLQIVPGDGYCLTTFGVNFIGEDGGMRLAFVEARHTTNLIQKYGVRFGPGFIQRAVESIRCYESHAFLAACAMAGAAAESILLRLASELLGQDDAAKLYSKSGGRKSIKDKLVQGRSAPVRTQIEAVMTLVEEWRDETSHGQETDIGADEAATAIDLVVRFAKFADERWDELTKSDTTDA
jgi:hypothetical protein